ncbi:hypothetical protein BBP40_003930 [Aspergillus hancockii]|nr:hypothetical protein BBP40_003930 [Aspergillus hancockii]
MPRRIYLALFSNGPRPAHWAIFIPTPNGTGHQGKVIHVTGTTTEDRKYQIMPPVDVDDRYVADTVGDGKPSCDTYCSGSGEFITEEYVEALNCRHWMTEYVQRLVDEGFLGGSAVAVLAEAPRRF